jgi:TMEM175 potassium channel family protein
MSKGRLEAFSDGVIAVIITIMVLEMKPPSSPSAAALVSTAPAFLTYLLSFVFVGIYWNNHHHLLHTAHHINGSILWANLHLLFWLSLAPFVTAWMGQNHLAPGPVAAYGGVLLCAAVAYFVLTRALLSAHGKDSKVAKALGNDFKGKVSMLIYAAAIPLAFVHPLLSCLLYVLVAIMWLVPDRRIEKVLTEA